MKVFIFFLNFDVRIVVVALIITIKVKPNAGKQQISLDKTGAITCFIKSLPEDGKANHELIRLLSKKLGLTQQDITIVQGLTSRTKNLRINTYDTKEKLYQKLDLPLQSKVS